MDILSYSSEPLSARSFVDPVAPLDLYDTEPDEENEIPPVVVTSCTDFRKLRPLGQLDVTTGDPDCLDIARYQGPLTGLSVLELLVHLGGDENVIATLDVYEEIKAMKARRYPDLVIPRLDLLWSAMKENRSKCETVSAIMNEWRDLEGAANVPADMLQFAKITGC